MSSDEKGGTPIPSEPTVDLLEVGLATFGRHVLAVHAALWSGPSPCLEWSVADLVRHLVDEHRWVPPLLGGLPLATAGRVVAAAGTQDASDLPPAWEAAAAASLSAWSEPFAARRVVQLARGLTPARQYLTELIVDLAVHSWDLARAIDADPDLPEELVTFSVSRVFSLSRIQDSGDPTSATPHAPPVSAPRGAPPVDRLVAGAGRPPWRRGAARHPPIAG